jgi:hypothetical protein
MPTRLRALSRVAAASFVIACAIGITAFAQATPAQNISAGSTVYRNNQYHFSLVVPPV